MKTIIKSILLTVALLTAIAANAQYNPITFGIKAGANLSSYSGDVDYKKVKLGFNAGITLDFALTPEVYLMSGLEFTMKGVKMDAKETFDIEGMRASVEFNGSKADAMYLQVPIHIGYKVNLAPTTKLVLHAGPYIAYGIAGKSKVGDEIKITAGGTSITLSLDEYIKQIQEENPDIDFDQYFSQREGNTFGDDGLKRFDFGIGLGAGLEFGKFGVNLGYDFGLANIGRKEGGIDYKIRNLNGYLSVGYKF